MPKIAFLALTASVLTLAACGGGGGTGGGSGDTPPPPPPPPPQGNQWTQGVFAPASDFKSRCETPRLVADANGDVWNDVQGTLSDEKFWLRSWSDETYLWYDEITDRNPDDFATPLDYFDVLRTERTTASGNLVDNFHGATDTVEYRRRTQGGPSAGYGWTIDLVQRTAPRRAVIAFTYGGVTSANSVSRGTEILEVDGVDLINGSDVDTLNAGLFPETAGESHTFKVRDVDGTEREITVTSAEVSPPTVVESRIFDLDDGAGGTVKAAYLNLDTFSVRTAERALFDAFTSYANAGVEELFLDLRYNGGGLLDMSAQLAYMVAGPQGNSTYYLTEFNDKSGSRNPVTGETVRPTPFIDETLGWDTSLLGSGRDLPTLDLDRVSIISLGGTCSASEAVINGLLGVGVDVDLIGNTTCGKPFGFYPTDNCGTTYFTIQFQGSNEAGFGEYADGFIPVQGTASDPTQVEGCTIADDYSKPLGDVTENMLEYAIAKRVTGTCPAAATTQAKAQAEVPDVLRDPATAIGEREDLRVRELVRNSLILGR